MSSTPLAVAVSRGRLAASFEVASVALFIYDYFITQGLEIELVWSAPWNPLKVMYLIQRYLPFADTVFLVVFQLTPGHSLQTCRNTFHITGWLFVLGSALSEVVLTARVWAVWNRDGRVGLAVILFAAMCWVPICVIMKMWLESITVGAISLPWITCYQVGGRHTLSICFVLLMVYDAGNLVLILLPGISAYKCGGTTGLFNTVYRDGVLYYLLIFALSAVNVIVILTLPNEFVNLMSSCVTVVSEISPAKTLTKDATSRAFNTHESHCASHQAAWKKGTIDA